jgi:hypothetical protein
MGDGNLLRGMFKSKTIKINAVLAALLCSWAAAKGVPLDPATATIAVTLLFALVNVILRFFTNTSLPEKGLEVPNPFYSQQAAVAIEQNPEALSRLAQTVLELLRLQAHQKKTSGQGKDLDLAQLARVMQAVKNAAPTPGAPNRTAPIS